MFQVECSQSIDYIKSEFAMVETQVSNQTTTNLYGDFIKRSFWK
jgi:hypothetical protein